MREEHDVLLLIADIGGYTRFMVENQTELTHSHEIIGALLEAIIAEVEIPLTVAKLEGDAVFCWAIRSPGVGAVVRERLIWFFQAFSSKLNELAAMRSCSCGACRNVRALRLKMVIHSGRALVYSIGERTELAGVNVIIAHRLLKNSIGEEEYILVTQAAAMELGIDLPLLRSFTEQYEAIGAVELLAFNPRHTA